MYSSAKNPWLLIVLVALFFSSCKEEKFIPDVSKIKVEIKIKRFEQDLFQLDTNDIADGLDQLREKYGNFFEEVYLRIMSDPSRPDAAPEEIISEIIKNEQVRKLYDTCMLVYKDPRAVEQELSRMFKFYKYYLPERPVPEVVSYISEFSLGTFTYGDSLVGFSWEFFLGANDPHYDPAIFPNYIQRTMTRDYLLPKIAEAVAGNLVGDAGGNRLLDFMIQNGKTLYIKDLLLPETPDSIKLEYTAEQVKWVENNELEVWAHFLKENLLYSSKMRDIQKLINHSPVAPGGMPQEAPGRTANWLGWQIVKAYMKKFPDTTLEELLAEHDAQTILDKSKYKPKR